MKHCIVIPVHNEAQYIQALIKPLKDMGHDVIVIDDGSTDETSSIAEQCGAIVIKHGQRSGKGTSLRDGFAYAVEQGYDGAIAMDGDGQHDPKDIPKFIQAAVRNPDCVITGNRMDNPENMPFIRLCTNRFMSWLISLACRQTIKDTQCGYRYISRAVLEQIHLTSRDFEIETEILMKANKKGFKILSVPIQAIYRDEKSKINPFLDTIRFFSYFIKEICSSKA